MLKFWMRLKAGASMLENREKIIAKALLVLIDTEAIRVDFFTAKDVLVVAEIGKEEIEKARKLFHKQRNMQEILKTISVGQ